MTKAQIMRYIYKEIDNLPSISDNLIKIQNLIASPKSDVNTISSYVKKDVGLTANILRVANSPWYMPIMRIETVERAITIIGLRRLYSIVIAIGAKKVLDDRVKLVKTTWKHSYKCAFFAQNLLKSIDPKSDKLELSYIGGLLHDMGKIILLSLSPDLIKRIYNISEIKKISVSDIEKQTLGFSHSEIGSKIAVKWKFPQSLHDAIAYHHNIKNINEEFTPVVYSVYLANILSKLEEPSDEVYNQIEPKVLEYYKIKSPEKLNFMVKLLIDSYSIAPEIQFI